MTRDQLNALCAALPGAERTDPWGDGHDAWKIGGKMFASMGAVTTGVSVKTDSIETAEMLIQAGIGTKAAYFHRSWLHLPEDIDIAEAKHRIETSYHLIRSKLPKKIQAQLP